MAEYTAGSNDQRDYLWLGHTLIASLDTTPENMQVYYVATDFLGTPRRITSTQGQPVWSWPYLANPFGERPAGGGYTFHLRFPGQYHDVASGLNYNVHRDYDATSGRYVESDPIGMDGGDSTYSYAQSNPLAYKDLLGLFSLTDKKPGPDAGGWVECDGGILKPVINIPSPYNECPAFGVCALVHEKSHIRDANAANPGLCHWYSRWLGQIYLTSSGTEEEVTELEAYWKEYDCLERFRKKLKCKGDYCKYLIDLREDQISNIIEPEIMNGTYGGG